MESVVKKPVATPKTIINQKFGTKACYKTEEVIETLQNGCPGLNIPQQGPCLFRCYLELPEFSVTSEPFKSKKEAEQSAAKIALDKLGIDMTATVSDRTVEQAWDELVARVSFLFSNELLSLSHPLTGHFREALRRKDDIYSLVPVTILATCDQKLNVLCKAINRESESDLLLNASLIMRAAKLSDSIAMSEGKLWLRGQRSHSPEIVQKLINRYLDPVEDILIKALHIPCYVEKPVQPISINVSSNEYYMDVIARKLGAMDASQVLVSRTVGKASSEMRFYFCFPEGAIQLDSLSDVPKAKEGVDLEATLNARASYLSGQSIYGDAILASIGYTRKASDLFKEDVSLGTYYRMLIGRLPDGGYKLSREAILVADLPATFTTRSNWRGSIPRDLLFTFCRQNWLSEPEFSTICINNQTHSHSETKETCKKLKSSKPDKGETEYRNGGGACDTNGEEELAGVGSTFRCDVKISSRIGDLIIECSSEDTYKKQNDALQNVALRVLSWLNKYFKQLGMPKKKASATGDVFGIHVNNPNFSKEFSLFLSAHSVLQASFLQKCSLNQNQQDGLSSLAIEGPESGVCPSNGSFVCISYVVSLVKEGEDMKEILESSDRFEFEIGTGSVIPQIEACVNQMSTNQSARFFTELPHHHLILAAAGDLAGSLPPLSLQNCCLEYSINLLGITEPLEDRMEQALFSPPLSKQRVEYAVKHINESHATTLVDFGCGSGSLLESLLDHFTSLEKIVGVDISRRSLSRAAKVLHSKLTHSDSVTSIKSAMLYDGSITTFDHRLYGFDIGTCLEVIEHMEEDQACLFGDIVLGSFCPTILIVSTPNYEYNPILQRISLPNQTEEGDEKAQSLPCRFRNHDHKFEWTREQFNNWASGLASRHDYSVEFSGVGGHGDQEPGFASQIAVFRKGQVNQVDEHPKRTGDVAQLYEIIWEWPVRNSENLSTENL